MTKQTKINKSDIAYYVLAAAITLGFVAVSVFVFPSAAGRLIESGRDFGLSVGYYFCELFEVPHDITPAVTSLPSLNVLPSVSVPDTWGGFKEKWCAYWRLWATWSNFKGYFVWLGNMLADVCKIIIIAVPFVLILFLLFKRALKKQNNDYGKDTKPLKCWKTITAYTYSPVKKFIAGFIAFLKERKAFYMSWLFIWAYNFNLFTIVLEFLAFYFYFVITFDVSAIYRQIYKLILDLAPAFRFIPVWVWFIVAAVILDKMRKKIGYARLRHMEMRNRGFINARPIVYMVCGTMGKKKTTAITDMALSQEVMFRDKAFEKILENDLKFPYFPWINLENELKRAMEHHKVYNLATVRAFISKKQARFEKAPCRQRLFDYDYGRYGMSYSDDLKTVDIWQVLKTYSQLYFIYVIQSSLLISNYSVRVDGILSDIGNFPLWDSEFFKRDSRLSEAYSRHSHILDFDSLRLGKKLVEDNPNANNFEFGVVLLTEVGKERGNNLENQEKKKKDETANQKNDGFNRWLKMVRHSATVDNFPFVRVICDEQRPESLGADARDLCEIVHIRNSGETKLTMPFFSLGELLYGWLFPKFTGYYYNYRFVRSDNTLIMYWLKGVTAAVNRYYNRVYNRFGYCVLNVQIESGTQDGQLDNNKYFIMSKKIYGNRFSTDCFSDFFTKKSLRSPVGIDDLPEYATEKAAMDELVRQNSYFIGDLIDGFGDKK